MPLLRIYKRSNLINYSQLGDFNRASDELKGLRTEKHRREKEGKRENHREEEDELKRSGNTLLVFFFRQRLERGRRKNKQKILEIIRIRVLHDEENERNKKINLSRASQSLLLFFISMFPLPLLAPARAQSNIYMYTYVCVYVYYIDIKPKGTMSRVYIDARLVTRSHLL